MKTLRPEETAEVPVTVSSLTLQILSGVMLKNYTLEPNQRIKNFMLSWKRKKNYFFNSNKDGFISHFLKGEDHTDG